MRVFGGRYKVLKKKNPDSMWYKTEKQTVRCGFDDWREMYIKDFKVGNKEDLVGVGVSLSLFFVDLPCGTEQLLDPWTSIHSCC